MASALKLVGVLIVFECIEYRSAYGLLVSLTGTEINRHTGKDFDGTPKQNKLLVTEKTTYGNSLDVHNGPIHKEHSPPPVIDETFDNPYEKNLNIVNNVNNIDFDSLISKVDTNYENSCLLDNFKIALLWWTFPNGTLRNIPKKYSSKIVFHLVSTRSHFRFFCLATIHFLDMSFQRMTTDDALYTEIHNTEVKDIIVFSAAHNNLTRVPYRTLEFLADSLKYLTLSGNNFNVNTRDTPRRGKFS